MYFQILGRGSEAEVGLGCKIENGIEKTGSGVSEGDKLLRKYFPHVTPTHKLPWAPPWMGFGKMWEETNLEYYQISQRQITQRWYAYTAIYV